MAKTYDATPVPATVTITNKGEGKVFLQLFKTNFKAELNTGDVVKLVSNESAEVLYYMLLDGKQGLEVKTALKG